MPVAEASVDGERPVADAPSAPRVRVVSVTVQLQVVADDGGPYLEPLVVQPITVKATDWAKFDLDTEIADLQRQLDER